MDVYYLIDSEYKIPKNAIASMKSLGFVDGKGIFLEFEKECSGADCALDGDEIQGKTVGMLGSMLGEGEISEYSSELTQSVKAIIGDIGKEGQPGSINETVRQLEIISKNVAAITASTNTLITNSSANLNKTIDNMASITGALTKSNQKIEQLLANIEKITGDIAKGDLKTTIGNTNATLDASKTAIASLQTTLTSTNNTMKELDVVLSKINKGDGSLGKLMNDKQLYTNLTASTNNLNLLLQDLRLNPKRYAHFSVFGKGQKEYTLPEQDPAAKQD